MSVDEDRLAKLTRWVQKLLKTAADPRTPEAERERANIKAAELIAEYGIDAALRAGAEPGRDQVARRQLTFTAPYAYDKLTLFARIATKLRCQAIRISKRPMRLEVFGFEADIERTNLLYASLLLQVVEGLNNAQIPAWEDPRAFKRAWMQRFTEAVCRRLEAAEGTATQKAEDTRAQGPSVELVLADRSAQVALAYQQAHPKRRRGSRRRLSSNTGGRQGYAAGMRADLGTDTQNLPSDQTNQPGQPRAIDG